MIIKGGNDMAIEEIIKNKKYRVIVSYRNFSDQPRNKKKVIYGTMKDALLYEAQLSKELEQGFDPDITYKNIFEEYTKLKSSRVKKETSRKEKEIYTKYLSVMDNKPLKSIKPIHMLSLRNHIESVVGADTEKNKSIYLFKRISKHAHRYYSFSDYSADIDLFVPKVKDRFQYNTLTPDEFNFIISFETLDVFKVLYELYFWAGLRRGEALALFKRDLLPTKEISVSNSINNEGQLGPLKNTSSYRRVLLHDDLFNRLLSYQASKGLYLLGNDSNLAPTTVNRRFKIAQEKANSDLIKEGKNPIPNIRIHDLRHSHATYLASKGIPITAISARLGHSSINETMNTYMHLFKGDDTKIVSMINLVV